MAVLSAPVILSVTLDPTTITANSTIRAVVEWEGFPHDGVAYQWRRASRPIAGETAATYRPTEAWPDLNCLVTIDNGRGTAISASAFATLPDDDDEVEFRALWDGSPATWGGEPATWGSS